MPDEPESTESAPGDPNEERIAALERRVALLEQRLRESTTASLQSEVAGEAARRAGEGVEQQLEQQQEKSALERAAERRRERAREMFALREQVADADEPVQVSAELKRAQQRVRPAKAKESRERINIERMIGGRWYAVIGALIVITGVALAFKLAWDQGWFGRLPDWGKCLGGAGFGALLLVVGELARKKIKGWGCAGLNSAGIGVLFSTAYAAFARFGLFEMTTTMVLLGAIAVLGVVIAARSGLVTVGVVALIGGFLVPMLLGGAEQGAWVLPSYWVMLLATGLGVSAVKLGRFHALRSLAWWGTGVVATPWMLDTGVDHLAVALVFAGVCWAVVHAELIVSALREKVDPGYAGDRAWWSGRVFVASFSTTAWCAALGAHVVAQAAAGHEWIATGVGVVLACGVAAATAGNLRVLRDRPTNAIERLGASLAVQAGALVIATVILGVSVAWVQMVCWLAMGVASVGAGRWLRARGLDVYGAVVLVIATGRVLVLDWGAYLDGDLWWNADIYGLHLTAWSVLCASTAAAWMLAGAMELRWGGKGWSAAGRDVGFGIGMAMLAAAPLQTGTESAQYFVYLPMVALATGLIGVLLRSDWLGLQGIIGLIVSVFGGIALEWWTDAGDLYYGLVVSDWAKRCVWIAAAWAAYGWLAGGLRSDWFKESRRVLWLIGVGVLMAAFVNSGADRASVHSAWLGLSAVLCARAFVADRRVAEVIAVPALVATAVAWVFAYIEPGWATVGSGAGNHAGLWSGLGMVALALVLGRRHGTDVNGENEQALVSGQRVVSFGLALVLGFAATSFEVARSADLLASDEAARLGAVSIWWALFAGGLLVLGFVKRVPAVRYIGLGLLGIAAVKAVVFDLRDIAPAWRVASFLSVGILMLVVGVVYARVDQVVRRSGGGGEETDQET